MDWLKFCLPGSTYHFARLVEKGFELGEKNRVHMVVQAVAVRGRLPLMVAEEAICKNLKPTISESNFGDMSMRGQDINSCLLDEHGQVEVWTTNADSNDRSRVVTGGFSTVAKSHYHPHWSGGDGLPPELLLRVRFSSDNNLVFNVKEKCRGVERKKMESEPVVSIQDEIDSKDIQVLMNKNRSIVLDIEFVAGVFYLDPKKLVSAIRVEQSGIGFLACIDQDIFAGCKLRKIKQLDQVREERVPAFDRLQGDVLAYGSKGTAVVSLLLHLLMNLTKKNGSSWSFRVLQNAKELVLIVPVSRNKTTYEVVGTLFRNDAELGTKVYCRFFNKLGKTLPAFAVAQDDEGRF
jgi:hypothetical protein